MHRQPANLLASLLVLALVLAACTSDGDGSVPEGGSATAGAPEGMEVMFVQNSADVAVNGNVLVMKRASPSLIMFSDRPNRSAGHVTFDQFEKIWNTGENSFKTNPPNAVLSVLGGTPVESCVVTLRNPRQMGGDVHFDITFVDGEAPKASGPSSLFIDPVVVAATPPAYVVAPPVDDGSAAAGFVAGAAVATTAAVIAHNNWYHHDYYHGHGNVNVNVHNYHGGGYHHHGGGGGYHRHGGGGGFHRGGGHHHGGFHRR